MISRARIGTVLAASLALLATVAVPYTSAPPPPAAAAGAQLGNGRVLLTGHPADIFAQERQPRSTTFNTKPEQSRNIVKWGIGYVTKKNPAPRFLFITGAQPRSADDDHQRLHPAFGGLARSGFQRCVKGSSPVAPGCYETAHICYASFPRQSPCPKDVNDLRTVKFDSEYYDAMVVSSDPDGISQHHMDVLVARQCELYSYVNDGRGLLAFSNGTNEGYGSGGVPGQYQIRNPFGYFPFLKSHKIAEFENNWNWPGDATAEGEALGFNGADAGAGNSRHNYFVIDRNDANLEDDKFVAVDTMAWPEDERPPDRPPGSSGNEPVDISVASDKSLRECPYSIGVGAEAVEQLEGAAGTATEFKFNISAVWHDGTRPVTVRYALEEGSATLADDDLRPLAPGSVRLTPGESTKTVVVTVNGDAKEEPDEGFVLRLSLDPSAPTGAQIDTPWVTGTIVNDDAAAIATPTTRPLPILPDDDPLERPGGDPDEPRRAAAPVAPGTPTPPPPGEIPGLGPGNTQAPGTAQGPGSVPNPNVPPAPSAAAQPVTVANAAVQPQALAQAQPAMMVERQRQLQLQTEQVGRGRTALAAAEGDRLDPTLALAGAWALTVVGGAVLFRPRRRPAPMWAKATTRRLRPGARR